MGINETHIGMGSDVAWDLGRLVGDLISPNNERDDWPGDHKRFVTFVLRNCTSEDITFMNKRFDSALITKEWALRPIPTKIPAFDSRAWIIWNDCEATDPSCQGNIWFSIGGQVQVNIDFESSDGLKGNTWLAYLASNNNDRYALWYYGQPKKQHDTTMEVIIGYPIQKNHLLSGCRLYDAPACAAYSKYGKIHFVHQANDGSSIIWWGKISGDQYQGEDKITEPSLNNPRMRGRACLLEFKDRLYCFYQGVERMKLWYTSYSASDNKWSYASGNMNAQSVAGPTAVVFRDRMWVFHQDDQNEGVLFFTTSADGNEWRQGTRVINDRIPYMSGSPSAVVYNNEIYIFFHGLNGDSTLNYIVSDENNEWKRPQKVPGVKISESPTALVVNGQLTVWHHGENQNGSVWYTTFLGEKGWKDLPVVGPTLSYSPAVAFQGSEVHLLHHESGKGTDMYHVQIPVK